MSSIVLNTLLDTKVYASEETLPISRISADK